MNGTPQGKQKEIKSLDEMLEYIYWETDKTGVEMGAMVLKFIKNGNISYEYYVFPHNENDQTTAVHNTKTTIGDRYFDAEERYLFHTHNSDVSPSYEDYANTGFSSINKSFVVTKSYMYRVTQATVRYPGRVYNPYRNQNPSNYWNGRIPLSFI